MRMFTGCGSGRTLARHAGSIALGAAALALLPTALPAQAADLEYGYGERYEYRVPAYPRGERYSEYDEEHVPAPPVRYGKPREYRVVIYPVKPDYREHHGYSPRAYPPHGYSEHFEEYEYEVPAAAPRVYAPRPVYGAARVYRPHAGVPYEPYGRAVETEPLLPPALVGPPRW